MVDVEVIKPLMILDQEDEEGVEITPSFLSSVPTGSSIGGQAQSCAVGS